MTHPVRAWVFDLGGVLVRFDDTRLRSALRPDVVVDEWWRFVLHSAAYRGFETGRASLDDVVAAGRPLFRPDVTDDEVVAAIADWPSRPHDRAFDALARARATGLPVVLLSNTNPLHWGVLEPRFAAWLDDVFLSYRVGALKPDPAIYAAVEAKLGVAPDGLCFFDDLEHNVAVARARGWQAHRVDGPDDVLAALGQRQR